jgi:hypothetical protein
MRAIDIVFTLGMTNWYEGMDGSERRACGGRGHAASARGLVVSLGIVGTYAFTLSSTAAAGSRTWNVNESVR